MNQAVRYLRIVVGLLVAGTVVAIPVVWLEAPMQANRPQSASLLPSLWRYWTFEPQTVRLHFAHPTEVAVGDPLFVHEAGPEHPIMLRRVGEIQALLVDDKQLPASQANVSYARALIYPSAPPVGPDTRITYRTKPQSVAWVIGALLTPERKARIVAELDKLAADHHAELTAALKPAIESTLKQLLTVLEEETPKAIDRHRDELASLGDKYRREIVDKQFLPLIKSEILPIAKARAEPVARQVGEELWQKVSVWRFGWRLIYDVSPLPEKKLTDQEWNRFFDHDAMPILEKHSEDFAGIIRDVIRDTAANKQVQETTRQSLAKIAEDPQLHAVLRALLREVIVDNPRFRETVDQQMNSAETRHALDVTSARVEPALRRIGDMIFGTQSAGITPEFAQVLRSEILYKDHRWFLVDPPAAGDQPAKTGSGLTIEVEYGSR
jgi:hypothetical protein